MRTSLLKISVGLAFLCATIFSGLAAQGMVALPGHVPAAVSRLKPARLLSPSANLNLAIGLPLRNKAALNGLLQQIYDPSSPNYHHYLTPEQFTARFGPTEQDYQKVVDFARTNGLTKANSSPAKTSSAASSTAWRCDFRRPQVLTHVLLVMAGLDPSRHGRA